uniref:Uncharacterized protein n=1 Tax=Rhizophora mucronata TaxID=61149 RepID=A0A2P2NZT2_RHIMU
MAARLMWQLLGIAAYLNFCMDETEKIQYEVLKCMKFCNNSFAPEILQSCCFMVDLVALTWAAVRCNVPSIFSVFTQYMTNQKFIVI